MKRVEEKQEKVKTRTSYLLQHDQVSGRNSDSLPGRHHVKGVYLCTRSPFPFPFPLPLIWLHCCSIHLSILVNSNPLIMGCGVLRYPLPDVFSKLWLRQTSAHTPACLLVMLSLPKKVGLTPYPATVWLQHHERKERGLKLRVWVFICGTGV